MGFEKIVSVEATKAQASAEAQTAKAHASAKAAEAQTAEAPSNELLEYVNHHKNDLLKTCGYDTCIKLNQVK